MVKLSILIPSFNAESTIRETLESIRWADEILICDSYSTDRTLEIAREFGAKIIQHAYLNAANQKNWALPQCQHDWVLILDTDEVLETGGREEIQAILESGDALNGYLLPRKNFIYGKWVRRGGIYPDYQERLIRRRECRYDGRAVHEHMIIPGKAGILKHHLLHEGFKSLSVWVPKLDRYSRYEVEEILKSGRKPGLLNLYVTPFLVFWNIFILKLGFLEGYRGFLLAALESFACLVKYGRYFEWARIKK